MGEKMAGTNEFAFFRCKSICAGGGSRIRPKKIRKMPSGRYRYNNLLFQRTVFQEPKPQLEQCLSVQRCRNTEKPFPGRSHPNQNLEPFEPSCARTVAKPDRTGTILLRLSSACYESEELHLDHEHHQHHPLQAKFLELSADSNCGA